MKHEKRPVTLEDLLRVKRAERPPAEFWTEFDRQLRTKQLSALVERRPWWHGLSEAFASLRRYPLPIGAAAALAITFITLRQENAAPQLELRPEIPAVAVARSAETSVPVTRAILAESQPAGSEAQTLVATATTAEPAVKDAAAAAVELMPAAPAAAIAQNESPRMLSLLVGAEEAETASPSARHIAANFAVATASEPIGTMLLGKAREFGSHRSEVRVAAIDPLQQMAAPAEMRRARYLTAMVSTTAVESSARTSERMANRISAEELYDQVERFGTRRGGFNVKF
jgi:hypothetical protein